MSATGFAIHDDPEHLLMLPPGTLLDQVSVMAAIAWLRARDDAPIWLNAGRDQLNLVRAHLATNSSVTNLMEVPPQCLFGARQWWLAGSLCCVIGG